MSNPTFSILIPSLRDDCLSDCLVSLINNNRGIDYEIVINKEKIGIPKATNDCFNRSTGDFIVCVPDDCLFAPNALREMLPFLMEDKKSQAEFRITNREGHVSGPCRSVKNKYFARFFAMSRELVNEVGGIFDENFHGFYNDSDLSHRVWRNGGQVRFSDKATIISVDRQDKLHEDNFNLYHDKDRDYFLSKWN